MSVPIGHMFMERTKYQYAKQSDQMKGVQMPPLQEETDPEKKTIPLPDPRPCNDTGLTVNEALSRRRSVRQYAPISLSMEELSILLWATQGVQSVIPGSGTLRAVPSAGARHAFETFLYINHVDGLNSGLYRYLSLDHQLQDVNLDAKIGQTIREGCMGQSMVLSSGVTFIWTAVPYRMTWRYGERGYRYLHLDAGHVCQNLYLSAETIDCGVCAIAAFEDETMNHILGFDGKTQFVIYIATVGKRIS